MKYVADTFHGLESGILVEDAYSGKKVISLKHVLDIPNTNIDTIIQCLDISNVTNDILVDIPSRYNQRHIQHVCGYVSLLYMMYVTQVLSRSHLLVAVNDLRALHYVSMGKSVTGSINCSCKDCDLVGWRINQLGTTVYPSALHFLDDALQNEPVRREWMARNEHVHPEARNASQPRRLRDKHFRVLAGRAAEAAKGVSKAALKRAVDAGGYHGLGKLHCTVSDKYYI
jgi:hypothetical protein